MQTKSEIIHVRTLFISDVHLGTRGCQAHALLDFIRVYEAETIFLVGDIIDGWRLKSNWHWPQSHNDVVQKILRKVRKGTRLIYVPGNHDEFLRDYSGSSFGGIEIVEEALYETADGRRMLIIHGDKFDAVVCNVKWLALLGDWAYDIAIWINQWIAKARRAFNLPYWSFSAWSKSKVKQAVNFISAYEEAVVSDGRKNKADIVLCGHIHSAAYRYMHDILYINTGDWIESNTAVIEHKDGRLELIHWSDQSQQRSIDPTKTTNIPIAA